jgi:hypothetical protein
LPATWRIFSRVSVVTMFSLPTDRSVGRIISPVECGRQEREANRGGL